ncbi:MAG: HNH endonuclease [Turicibacter sp.]|nr:HNH endonuclease [Turicibacter sp.]
MTGRPKGVKNSVRHVWTEEQKAYLGEITPGRHHKEIMELVNEKFGLELVVTQISRAINSNGFKTGFTGRFEKGNVPFNKGKTGFNCGKETAFKKGHRPATYRPVGSERVGARDGYTEIKIADPNVWKLKHRWLWEQHNGPVPKGYALIFADGDKSNITLDNLIVVSRAQLVRLNKNHLIQENKELTETAINVVDLMLKINHVKKIKRK